MAEIYIYDELGPDYWGLVSAKVVMDQLARIPDAESVTLRINSPGGDVNEGIAIYNAIRRRGGPVTAEIDALAASAASYVAMAAGTVNMAENAMMMIHSPWTIAMGNAEALRQTADILDKYNDGIVDAYAKRSGTDREKVAEWMAAETWFTAAEAVEAGLADNIGQTLNVAAKIRPGMFNKVPERVAALGAIPMNSTQMTLLERKLKLLALRMRS